MKTAEEVIWEDYLESLGRIVDQIYLDLVFYEAYQMHGNGD